MKGGTSTLKAHISQALHLVHNYFCALQSIHQDTLAWDDIVKKPNRIFKCIYDFDSLSSSGSAEVDVEPRRSTEADKSFDTKVIGLLECHNGD